MPDWHGMSTLIERRHRETRARIVEAAIHLFLEHGFDETTMDDIADAAGVSRRTVYRHFPAKDDLVFEQPEQWLPQFEREIATRTPGESLHDVCCRGLKAVAQHIQDNARSILPAFAVYVATPSLRGRNGRTEDDWFERYVSLLTPDEPPSAATMLEIATLAGSLVGTTKALVAVWATSQPNADMVDMTQAALAQLEPIWPDWLR
jgi:AcrR family transcriptional regulator